MTARPNVPPLDELQLQWKSDFWEGYREQFPVMAAGGLFIIIISAFWLAPLSTELAIIAAILQVLAFPVLALAPAWGRLGAYPTKANRDKTLVLLAVYDQCLEDEKTEVQATQAA